MIKLSDLHNVHAGRPAAILGGGPSLPSDLAALPEECVLFAANDHAFHIGVEPDYMVVMDDPHIKPELLRISETWRGGLRINPLLDHTDVDMRGVPFWRDLSSMTAAWLADFMGCDPILLCGMDLYQGERKYCHDKDDGINKPIYKQTLEQHITHWKLCFYNIPGVDKLRAVSGPLVEVFGGLEYAKISKMKSEGKT